MSRKLPSALFLVATVSVCGACRPGIAGLYQAWSAGTEQGQVLARLGKLQLRASSVFFSTQERTITPQEFARLALPQRELVLKQLLIRRQLIAEALRSGDFETEEARQYLLPRLERLLEEYHLKRLAQRRGREVLPPEAAVRRLLEKRGRNPELAPTVRAELAAHVDEERLRRARREVVRRILREEKLEITRAEPPIGRRQ